MATVLGLSLLAILVISFTFNHHHHVEGRKSMSVEEEDLQLEAQLKSLNKLPTKTIYAEWGDIYDCIEFHKQPAFDHPLVKRHKTLISSESLPNKPNITLLVGIEGCPKGTVPIRRTTREDLIRAKSLSSPFSSSEANGGIQYRAGFTLPKGGQKFHGGSGIVNVWSPEPKVDADQFSSAEIALKAGPYGQVNAIKFGWMVNPQLYGDNVTRGFAYWTGDGGHNTGCYNHLCPGFVQVHPTVTPDLPFPKTSKYDSTQFDIKVDISLERETGRWWLTLQDREKVGYWPNELFPLFKQGGVDYIYWGGRVKSGANGAIPPMCSGVYAGTHPKESCYFLELQYKDANDNYLKPDKLELLDDCPLAYHAIYYPKDNAIFFGGTGGRGYGCM
ncbi:hypothetical protein MKW92_044356 [Papaver armeniacum]|nr:hypothetical protein MKW92_044356 [Papaver armeniacum]